MGRAFGLVMLLIAFYVMFKVHTEGVEQAFGGIFAPLESVNQRETPLGTSLTPIAQGADLPAPPPERRIPITDAVRERTRAHVQQGTRRLTP